MIGESLATVDNINLIQSDFSVAGQLDENTGYWLISNLPV